MPELPEVETLRRSLEPLVGQRIEHAQLVRPDVLAAPAGADAALALLAGDRVQALVRRGKQLAIVGASGRVLIVQLGMSGQVLLDPPQPLPSHTHAWWRCDSGLTFAFRDPRRFGGLTALPNAQALDAHWLALGPDALDVTAQDLQHRAAESRRAIKAALLDQQVLAGVGNIYADEALFASAIRPSLCCDRLPEAAWPVLARCIRSTLQAAITARGSTLRDYRDASGQPGEAQHAHAVYGRAGSPCPRCGTAIRCTQVAQRTTCYCPACQPTIRALRVLLGEKR